MAERISLENAADKTEIVNLAAESLREGRLIIAPMEHAYIFVADAFNHGAVKKMHILRGDPLGTAAQVLVGDVKTATGITREFGANISAICQRFWPGLLTVKIPPAQGLVWDLGDQRTLEEIAIRVPVTEFLREIAQRTGPLAVASASPAGSKPRRGNRIFPALENDYAFLFDAGELPEGPATTVISVKDDGVTFQRAGAISLAELREVTPNIAVPA